MKTLRTRFKAEDYKDKALYTDTGVLLKTTRLKTSKARF